MFPYSLHVIENVNVCCVFFRFHFMQMFFCSVLFLKIIEVCTAYITVHIVQSNGRILNNYPLSGKGFLFCRIRSVRSREIDPTTKLLVYVVFFVLEC